jgi:hypothetical protein
LPFQSLDDNPRQHFAEFERLVYDVWEGVSVDSGCYTVDDCSVAGKFCPDSIGNHQWKYVDAVWADLPNNTTIINGEATTIDRNSFPHVVHLPFKLGEVLPRVVV